MRHILLFAILGCPLVFASLASGEEGPAPRPRVDRIDYGRPDAQRALPESLGAGPRSQGIVRQLAQGSARPAGTLSRIVRWVDRNLKFDDAMAGRWRGVDQIVKDGRQGGAADRALVIGAFARLSGIPTTWVKTIPMAWLIEMKRGLGSLDDAQPQVFLEVYLDGEWRLFDPASARLYERYDPRRRHLPGGQYVYDKGGDPHALLLPNRKEMWARQLRSYVVAFDLTALPWTSSRDMLAKWRVYIVGQGGAASYAKATAKIFGFKVEKCFNSDFDRLIAEARGKTLIVVTYGLKPALPKKYWRALLPPGYEQILSGQRKLERGWISHRLRDGTRVILVTASGYGPVELAVSEALEG